tara:strand:+ start:98 stop:2257 length:2160 start_codon:yes stop_codon:yes gene_type:complete
MGRVRKKRGFCVALASLALLVVPSIALGDQYSTLQGTITAPEGFELVRATVHTETGVDQADEFGSYSITAVASGNQTLKWVSFELEYLDPTFQGEARFNANISVPTALDPITDIQIPAPELMTLSVADAQANPIPNAKLSIPSEYSIVGQYSVGDGLTLDMSYFINQTTAASGAFQLWAYQGDLSGELFFSNQEQSVSSRIDAFSFPENNNAILCLPTNFAPDMTLAEECFNAQPRVEMTLSSAPFTLPGSTAWFYFEITDESGNPVSITESSIGTLVVTQDGPGLAIAGPRIFVDGPGSRALPVFIGSNDLGNLSLSVSFDSDGFGPKRPQTVSASTLITSSPDYSLLDEEFWPDLRVEVADRSGQPVAGALVSLFAGESSGGGMLLTQKRTGASGFLSFARVRPETIWVDVEAPVGSALYEPHSSGSISLKRGPATFYAALQPKLEQNQGGGGGGFFAPIIATPVAPITTNPIPVGQKLGAVDADGNAIDITPALAQDKKSIELSFGRAKLSLAAPAGASFSEDGKLSIAPASSVTISATGYEPDSTVSGFLVPTASLVASAFKIASEATIELGTTTVSQDGSFDLDTKFDAEPGSYLLQLTGTTSDGKQTTIALETLVAGDQTMKTWAKRLPGITEAKLYAKNIIGAGKVTFRVNGKEIAWIRAVDEIDPKLRVVTEGPMTGANYLVRTVKLNPGKNVLEVYIDGVRTTRVAYSRR